MFETKAPGVRRRTLAALACASALVAGLLMAPATAASAEPVIPAPDGLSEATAAASCWEIKQRTPAATSGVYWLTTPELGGPQQFYCDQERSGGGWVLVGRGRDGWSVSTQGSGTPAQVAANVTGTAAFAPRQLPGATIDQLLNGQPVSSLPDGIRLVRAKNTAGTDWHDMTFKFASPRTTWTWQFNNQQRVGAYRIGTGSYSGGNTSNFGRNNDYDRVRTITGSAEGWQMGFGFGSNIRGNPAASSYLWSKDTSTGYARPFTQVFIRPQLMSDDVFETIPDTGTPARSGTAVADGFALRQNWGVAGLGNGPANVEGSNEVSAFAEVGGSVFVGGNFLRVQKTASGGSAQDQRYLASFDRDTGEWNSGFRPVFNNQVKALAALPGGRVAAGGFFTEVNGQPHRGLVVLNATTGAVDTAFTGKLINRLSGGLPIVRTLDVQDGWLYVAGTFTHSTGGSDSRELYTRQAARFSVTDGTPDGSWNPEFNGTVISLDASARGDRVYFAGFFSQSKGRTADKGAALATANTDLFPWDVLFSNRAGGRQGYQQAVLEVGDRVWLGGAEHSLFSYSRNDFSVLSTSIGNAGGDFQAIATDGNAVYGGCHCFETQYEGATEWPSIGNGWTSADAVYGSGAWSAADGSRIPQFNGTLNTARGAGAWALFVDSTGVLWQGGDWTYSNRKGWVRQWSGGFVRHEQVDTAPPSTPGGLTATGSATGVALEWSASSDDRQVVGYEVLRNDRVVATVTDRSTTLPEAPASTKYFVRAVDEAGNRSASTPAVTAEVPPAPPEPRTLIAAGSTWSYVYSENGPGGAWADPGYDASSWATGAAPFGWGHANLATPLNAAAPKPAVSFYRGSFELDDASRVESMQITTRADDGIVVYVNGTDVGRVRVDPGPAGPRTYANAAVSAANAVANPVTISVPVELLQNGANTIAVSVHSNYRSTPSHSFELVAEATLTPAVAQRRTAETADDEATDETADDPADEATDEGTEKNAEKSTEKKTEERTDEGEKKPDGESTGESAEDAREKPESPASESSGDGTGSDPARRGDGDRDVGAE